MQLDLIEAVIDGDFNRVCGLLRSGVNPNAVLDSANVTPLHFAAQNTKVNVIKELLKYGADLQAKTVPDGESPLDIARLFNHPDIIRSLQ